MKSVFIGVDVSKGSCHYQPYVSNGHPMRKPKVLHDTVEDTNTTIDDIKNNFGQERVK